MRDPEKELKIKLLVLLCDDEDISGKVRNSDEWNRTHFLGILKELNKISKKN